MGITTAVGAVHAAEGWAEAAPTDQGCWWAWTQRDSASERMYAWSKADPGEVEIPDAGTSMAARGPRILSDLGVSEVSVGSLPRTANLARPVSCAQIGRVPRLRTDQRAHEEQHARTAGSGLCSTSSGARLRRGRGPKRRRGQVAAPRRCTGQPMSGRPVARACPEPVGPGPKSVWFVRGSVTLTRMWHTP